MANFVKIWTTLTDQPWYLTAPTAVQKCYIESCIFAKKQHDDGTICVKSVAEMHRLFTVNYRTMVKVAAFMQHENLWRIETHNNGAITIHVVDYHYWQGLRTYSDHQNGNRDRCRNTTMGVRKPTDRSEVKERKRGEGEVSTNVDPEVSNELKGKTYEQIKEWLQKGIKLV